MSTVQDEPEVENAATKPLFLESLEIKNFRGLDDLRIPRLGRVNLLVGKNNTGKTTVLEAIRLFARPFLPQTVVEILESRGEIRPPSWSEEVDRLAPVPLEDWFHRGSWGSARLGQRPIEVGPIGDPENTVRFSAGFEGQQFSLEFALSGLSKDLSVSNLWDLVQLGRAYRLPQLLGDGGFRFATGDLEDRIFNCPFLGPGRPLARNLVELWDAVVLTDDEARVLDGVRLVLPDVERLNFKEVRSGVRERAAFVKLKGSSVPVSMSSQGEGVNRLLGIALGLVNARGGMLLVDEIENGIHYSVQPQLWRLILATARDLSVQVFATTHSWDAVEGLRSAIGDPMGDEVVLINVNRRFDRLQATIFDQDELKLATEPSRIEVR